MSFALLPKVRLRRERVPSFERYPFGLPAVRGLRTLELHPAVTYFVGENGSGKSTLLEAIAVSLGFNPEGGTSQYRFQTRPSHSALHQFLDVPYRGERPTPGFFLRAESFFNVATEIERMDREDGGQYSHLLTQRVINTYGGKSLHEQSHGESFLSLFMHRFDSPYARGGIYLLDEPEAALSPTRQMSLLTLLHRLVRGGSQFIIATHSPIVLAYPDSRIYAFGEDGITETRYEETDPFVITREFLGNHRGMLRVLLEEGEDGDED